MTENTIKILDLGEACALQTIGFELLRIEPTVRKSQRAFIFTLTPPASLASVYPTGITPQKVVDDYWRKKLAVDAMTFFQNYKELKNRILNDLRHSKEID